jgi:hypothetical protein
MGARTHEHVEEKCMSNMRWPAHRSAESQHAATYGVCVCVCVCVCAPAGSPLALKDNHAVLIDLKPAVAVAPSVPLEHLLHVAINTSAVGVECASEHAMWCCGGRSIHTARQRILHSILDTHTHTHTHTQGGHVRQWAHLTCRCIGNDGTRTTSSGSVENGSPASVGTSVCEC